MDLIRTEYVVDSVTLTGFLADGSGSGQAPGVLLAHEGTGITQQTKRRARMLAERGYVVLALDMYGKQDLTLEESRGYSQQLLTDSALLRRRARAGLVRLASQASCDPARIAVVGICLGGIVALELARDGAQILGCIGIHPGLRRPTGSTTPASISAKILMVIGDNDPVAPAEARYAFAREMSDAGADWQLVLLGGIGHSFTNPTVDAYALPGYNYDGTADRRAWRYALNLLEELF